MPLCLGVCVFIERRSEYVPQRQDDPAISAVGSPLIEEIGRSDSAVGDAEMARIGCVVHFNPKLEVLAFLDSRVLDESEIDVVDAFGAECIPADITDSNTGRQRLVERPSPSRKQFFYAHP